MSEAHIFTFTTCCVYWDFSQVLNPFMTEQDHGLSLKIPQGSFRTYFVSIMIFMIWAWGDCFVPALLVISGMSLYHFTCGGELAAVISVSFSFSLHKSTRRHSQQRTVSHCLHQILDELHTPQLWGTQGPPRHVYV